MAIHPKAPKFKIGTLKLGTKLHQKITNFPSIHVIKERHYVGVLPRAKFEEHDRIVQVVSEFEVLVVKKNEGECYFCKNFGGYLSGENINKDPYVNKLLKWIP